MSTSSETINQTEFWNGVSGQRWAEQWAALDRAIRPFGEAALSKANARPGERVLDVGTGCGETLLALAGAVGSSGKVCGVDISAPMLAVARQRAGSLPQAELIEADAARFTFKREFDLVFSRFGVMFFEDPIAAFKNIRSAVKDGGRLAFVCWRVPQENPWVALPVMAVKSAWPDAPALPPAEGPGPFAFADAEKVKRVLEGAGFQDVQLERFDADVCLGESPSQAIEFALSAGPAARLMADATPEIRERVKGAMAEALTPHFKDGRCALGGSTWVVTAKAK